MFRGLISGVRIFFFVINFFRIGDLTAAFKYGDQVKVSQMGSSIQIRRVLQNTNNFL